MPPFIVINCTFLAEVVVLFPGFDEDSLDYDHLLATCGNDSLVKVWQVKTGEITKWTELTTHGGNVNYVRFSPNIRYILVSCATDNTARIWNVVSFCQALLVIRTASLFALLSSY